MAAPGAIDVPVSLDLHQLAQGLRVLARIAEEISCALTDGATDLELLVPDDEEAP